MIKKILIVIVIGLFVEFQPNQYLNANSREYVISPRIGSEIDKKERDYFNLFPLINNYLSATAYIDDNGEYSIIIKYDSLNQVKTIQLSMSEEAADNLKLAIERYEDMYLNNQMNVELAINWVKIIRTFIIPSYRYYDNKNKVVSIKSKSGEKISGNILWADSSYLVLCPEGYRYFWETTDKSCKAYHYSEIIEASKPNYVNFMGFKSIYSYNLSSFQEWAQFINQWGDEELPPPPEVKKLIDNEQLKNRKEHEIKDIGIEKLLENAQKSYHINIEVTPGSYFQVNSNISMVYENIYWVSQGVFGGYWASNKTIITNIGLNTLKTLSPCISFDYNISPNIKFGINFNYYNSEPVPKKTSGIKSNGSISSIYISYIKNHHNPYSFSYWNLFELTYSLGLTYGAINNKLYLYYRSSSGLINNSNNPIKLNQDILGVYADLKLSYFITEYLSLNTKLYANIFLPKDVKGWEYKFNTYNNISFDNSFINYTGAGIGFGLGYHL